MHRAIFRKNLSNGRPHSALNLMLLNRHNVDFTWIDTDADDAARAKAQEISGLPKIPVIVFPDGSFLSEPSNPQIEERLEANGLL